MIVTFVSQCEKKSLAKTRRVLDAYANRIGDNVWQTIITEEGLLMVKKLLRRSASKNTAVSCHWIRSRRRSDLLWIVGNRQKFNSEGIVPVNTTQRKLVVTDMEDDWRYLPMIKALTAIAALLHDWGKCSDLFQAKLTAKNNKFKGDPIRHEWISCLLLQSLVHLSGDMKNDEAWLKLLRDNQWDEAKLKKSMKELYDDKSFQQLKPLPLLAQMIEWIMVSHHRMPSLNKNNDDTATDSYEEYCHEPLADLADLFSVIQINWSYENNFDDDFKKRLPKCFKFSKGLLKSSDQWIAELQKWSKKLLACQNQIHETIENGAWRSIIQYARLSLMFGDHYFSSLPLNYEKKKHWRIKSELMANTDRVTGQVKQYLDEHLYGVCHHGLQAAHYLKELTYDMPYAHDLKKIKSKSPKKFIWQDNVVKAIKDFRKNDGFDLEQGWFIVNMASTGTGKTIANAKIMQALSKDGDALRYILALGLRTLTLQTGDSYRENLGMEKDELAVLIGSKAVQELHEKGKQLQKENIAQSYEEIGSESLEALLDEPIDYIDDEFYPDFMNVLFPKGKIAQSEKNRAFLYRPILVCTIDHIMGATETTRGGKYLLPYLRLLSSDLVVDEVDDFGVEDLIPLVRLIHLAGMLGRKVMISSATIPPSLAAGLFNAYQKGFHVYASFHHLAKPSINAMWVDEFKSSIQNIRLNDDSLMLYQQMHNHYIEKRCEKLFEQMIKQRAKIIPCEHIKSTKSTDYDETIQSQYFDLIQQTIVELHDKHHTIDENTGKKISFGVVRVANIPPCVALTVHLLNSQWPENIAPRAMAYHSRQVLLLRSVQEQHLDQVLSRKEKIGEMPQAFDNPVIRTHINNCLEDNIIFILVATPVEEVGRDHDFDWAVIEPSSYRSIIQLSGRVLRHRQIDADIIEPNIALMQFNIKGLNGQKVAFNRPGFESLSKKFNLSEKNLFKLIHHQNGQLNINATPRIQASKKLQAQTNLADLEHLRIESQLLNITEQGAGTLNGWLNEAWFLTGLSQQFYRFRNSRPDVQLCAVYNEDMISFCIKNDAGDWVSQNKQYDINQIQLSDLEMGRLWLVRHYYDALYEMVQNQLDIESDENKFLNRASKRYGEVMLPETNGTKRFEYSDQLGIFEVK